jgi:DNA topoisomerase IA
MHQDLFAFFRRWILEKNYGLKITELALIVLQTLNTSFKRLVLPILTDEIEELLECRRVALRRGKKEIVYWA